MEINPVGGQSQVVFPRAQFWGQFSFISLSMVRMRGLMLLKISGSEETMRESLDPGMAVDRLQKELLIRSHKYSVGPMPPDQSYHGGAGSQK